MLIRTHINIRLLESIFETEIKIISNDIKDKQNVMNKIKRIAYDNIDLAARKCKVLY